MRYQLRYSSAARHALKKIPRTVAWKFITEFQDLADERDPRLSVKRLQGAGEPPFYSLRIGKYRAIMSILDEVMVMHAIAIGHRSNV